MLVTSHCPEGPRERVRTQMRPAHCPLAAVCTLSALGLAALSPTGGAAQEGAGAQPDAPQGEAAAPDGLEDISCKGAVDCDWLASACEGIFISWREDGEVEGSCDNSTEDADSGQARDERARSEAAFQAGEIEEVQPVLLARFLLSNGSEVRFLAIPEDQEVGMVESVPEGSRRLFEDPDMSPLEAYLELAPASLAVPRPLVDFADPEEQRRAAKGRALVARLDADVPVDVDGLTLTSPLAAASVGYCTPTPAGALYFMTHSCGNENLQTSFCDFGSLISNWNWTTLIRQASSRKRKSHSRTAACGALGEVKHYYWNGSKWKTAFVQNIATNAQPWLTWNGAIKRYRKIRHRTFHPEFGGFVRAWSAFYN